MAAWMLQFDIARDAATPPMASRSVKARLGSTALWETWNGAETEQMNQNTTNES